ncbi:MAG: SDR family NAD(P)-dependent oxidoreductase, partial [Vicinamibacteria bacterium]
MDAMEGRVAVVTGAAGGLGREYARLFADEGARLVLVDIGAARDGSGNDPDVVAQLVKDIAATGADCVGTPSSEAVGGLPASLPNHPAMVASMLRPGCSGQTADG